ncbi:MAG: glycoside hydrolase family 71/99-like protein [Fimbriimonadaceae bacterium]
MLGSLILAAAWASGSFAAPPVFAHYMPWYEAKADQGQWGWHWTMNARDPSKGELASHYRPLIGAYDSGDPDVLEYHVLLMKIAGIQGVMIDWYGIEDLYDYPSIHRHTQSLVPWIKKAGLRFALMFEDQTLTQLIKNEKIAADQAVSRTRAMLLQMQSGWFTEPAYLRMDGRPLFFVFGPQYFKDGQWPVLLDGLDPKPYFVSLHHRVPGAEGAFDWPLPSKGLEGAQAETKAFLERAKSWPFFMPVAYPRFHDYYHEAGVHDSYGRIADDEGHTLRTTLKDALTAGPPMIQIATWNDWGEGTQIEPSQEHGYRDLETVMELLGRANTDALRLPYRLYGLRKAKDARADAVSEHLFAGRYAEARAVLGDH